MSTSASLLVQAVLMSAAACFAVVASLRGWGGGYRLAAGD
jgi:hypothetical protein